MTLTPHEQQQLQKNVKDNQAFFQMYNGDLAVKRDLRARSLEMSVKITIGADKEGQPTRPSLDEIIKGAEKIHAYLLQDVSMDDFASDPKIKLMQ